MADIVEQLRNSKVMFGFGPEVGREAADEIERLRLEVEDLRLALEVCEGDLKEGGY